MTEKIKYALFLLGTSSDWAIIINSFYWTCWTPELTEPWIPASPLCGSVSLLRSSWYCPWDFAVWGNWLSSNWGHNRGVTRCLWTVGFHIKENIRSRHFCPLIGDNKLKLITIIPYTKKNNYELLYIWFTLPKCNVNIINKYTCDIIISDANNIHEYEFVIYQAQ